MKNGSTWGHINSQRFSSRFFDDGFIFDNAGNCLFSDETNTYLPLIPQHILLEINLKY